MDPAASKARVAEQGIAMVRLAIVLFNTGVYAAGLTPTGIPWLAWATIAVANVYSIYVVVANPLFKTPLVSATWTTLSDTALIVVWLSATGAENSPFVLLWAVSLVAVAFRFGPAVTRYATGLYVLADGILLFIWGQLWPLQGLSLARLAYLFFIGILGTLMASTNLTTLGREARLVEVKAELENSQSEMTAILGGAPSIILRADREGTILYLNRAVPGIEKEQVVGHKLWDFAPPDQVQALRETLAKVTQTGENVSYEAVADLPEGKAVFQSQMGPVKHGEEVVGVVVISVDATEQIAQREAAKNLEIREQEIKGLQGREQFRKALLNTVAHELNTPLTPLKLQLRILRQRHDGLQGIDMLERNIDRLSLLVRDLLDVARIEEGYSEDSWERHDLRQIIHETIGTFAPIANDNDVTIKLARSEPALVNANRLRMSQVLYNLVSNAVKYSPQGGEVKVKVRQEAGRVLCSIADQGPGFTDEDYARLFLPFEQVHPTPSGHTGTGLGLFLTKNILAQYGGSLEAFSDGPGAGATFTFSLPVASSDHEMQAS